MKRKRRKRELTVKQVKTIAFIVSVCIFLGTVIMDIYHRDFNSNSIENVVIEQLGMYIILLIGAMSFYQLILIIGKVPIKELKEEDYEIRTEIMEMLSKTEFKEVSFQIKDPESSVEMLMDILEAEGCKFYAKFDDEEDGIILKCIDKSGEKIYQDTIKNGWYFKKFFKVS